MDPNYVRIVDKDKPGDYLVLHTHDLTPGDVLFDEKKHSFAALAAKKAAEAPKKPSDPPKDPDQPKPSAPAAPPAKK